MSWQISSLRLLELLAGLAGWLCFSAPAASASPEYFTQVWQTREGLPDNMVAGIVQTPDGFLWVATRNGLVRFDGLRFREVELANVPGLRVGENQGLALDHQGRLWLVKKYAGVICLDGRQSFSISSDAGLPSAAVTDEAFDGQDNLWLSSAGGRVIRIQGRAVRPFTGEDGLPSGGRCWLSRDQNGELWFGIGGKLGVFRGGKFNSVRDFHNVPALRILSARSGGLWILAGRYLMKFAEGTEPVKLGALPIVPESFSVSVLYEDHHGALWIGLQNLGLFHYDSSGFTFVKTSSSDILCVNEDREGNIWVGTGGGGLNRLQPRALELHSPDARAPGESIVSACEDTRGDLWCVLNSGVMIRRDSAAWTIMSTNSSLSDPPGVIRYATGVAASPRGGVWVGSRYDGLCFWKEGTMRYLRKPQGLAGNFVCALLVSPSGEVWLGTDTPNTLQRLRGDEFKTFQLPPGSSPVTALALDCLGNLWAGTSDGFLLRVSDDALVEETPKAILEPRPIQTLHVTSDNSLWVGYAGGGLGRLKAGHFTQFTTEQGLSENQVVQIVQDRNDSLWLAGNQGLSRVRLQDLDDKEAGRVPRLQPLVYGQGEGVEAFATSRCFWPSALCSTNGHLWFSTQSGLLEVKGDAASRNSLPPPVVIEQVTVDGNDVAIHNREELLKKSPNLSLLDFRKNETLLRLPAPHQRVDIRFTALSFCAPRHVGFKYKLEGLDKDWVGPGSARTAHFSHLAPGDYRFRVIACNNDGIWNESGASLAITVLTPFWQTGWFIALALLAAAGSIAGMARYFAVRRIQQQLSRLENEHLVERERSRIAKDMHDTLGASLSEITLLSEMAQGTQTVPKDVQADLRRIAGRSRDLTRSLAEIVWAVNPQHDAFDSFVTYTCNFVENYLTLAGIRCRLDVPPNLPSTGLTAHIRHNLFLLVKEAAHNIVKHAAASQVQIRVALKRRGFQLVIEDDGKGFDLKSLERGCAANDPVRPPSRHGLSNMRERAEDIGAKLELRSQPGHGTTVQLDVDLAGP